MNRRAKRFYEVDNDAVSVVPDIEGARKTVQHLYEFLMLPMEKIRHMLPEELKRNAKFYEAWNWAKEELGLGSIDESKLDEKQLISIAAKSYSAEIPVGSPMYLDFNKKTRLKHVSMIPPTQFEYKSLYYLLYVGCNTSKPFAGQPKRRNISSQHMFDSEVYENTGVVYRGCNFKFEARPKEDIMFHNFASTSLNFDVAGTFSKASCDESNVLYESTFFVLTNVVHGFDLRAVSAFPDEEEMLLLPFDTFQVLEVKDDRDTGMREILLMGTGTTVTIHFRDVLYV